MEFEYAETINPNLICCICHCPFVSPITAPCGHTFCEQCIEQTFLSPVASTGESSPQSVDPRASNSSTFTDYTPSRINGANSSTLCPVDRLPIRYDSLKKSDKIILNLVNELLVYCYERASGCEWKGQRQSLLFHAKECSYRKITCTSCQTEFLAIDQEKHKLLCVLQPVTCSYCQSGVSASTLEEHYAQDCLQYTITCPMSRFGCIWIGERRHCQTHQDDECKFWPMKDYLESQESKYEHLKQENHLLQESVRALDGRIERLEVQSASPAVDRAMVDEIVFERIQKLAIDMDQMKSRFDQLSAHMGTLELKSDMAVLTETSRLREEMQSLRVQLAYYLDNYRASNNSNTGSSTSKSFSNTKSQNHEINRVASLSSSAASPGPNSKASTGKHSTRL